MTEQLRALLHKQGDETSESTLNQMQVLLQESVEKQVKN